MTLEEIADTLPNGFHDAQINSISINYEKREVTIDLEIWVSDSVEDDSEKYLAAELKLLHFLFCVIEAPDATYPYHEEKALWVDAFSDKSNNVSSTHLPGALPEGAFSYLFFVNDWNSFIRVAALDAEIVLH
ncbi:hypothetical protein BH20ACI3_BH20ACI3_09210 [soil metagenome]